MRKKVGTNNYKRSISLEQSVCISKRNSTKNYYVNKGCRFCHVRLEVVMTREKFF